MRYNPAIQKESFRINHMLSEVKKKPKIRDIKLAVYDYFELDEEEADSKYRNENLVEARQIVHAICYKYKKQFGWTLSRIGEETGERDHSLVSYSSKIVNCHYQLESDFRDRFDRIERIIKSRFNL